MKALCLTRTIDVDGKPKALPVCVVPCPGMQFGALNPAYAGTSWIRMPGDSDDDTLIVDQTVAVIKKRLAQL